MINLTDILNEILAEAEDQTITCEKCGWEWKLDDGGTDPYIYHKCGHDNEIDEYDIENADDMKEFLQFMKEYKQSLSEVNYDYVHEAEYKGRKVQLGKPMQGDIKKFKVYVKNPAGNIVKVNFGHGGTSAASKGEKTMRIRKSNPDARRSFRARHNCDQPGPRHKARYWSCRKW